MLEDRYDIRYDGVGLRIVLHTPKTWIGEGPDFEQNTDLGFTFEEAKERMVIWHEQEAANWRSMTIESAKLKNII